MHFVLNISHVEKLGLKLVQCAVFWATHVVENVAHRRYSVLQQGCGRTVVARSCSLAAGLSVLVSVHP